MYKIIESQYMMNANAIADQSIFKVNPTLKQFGIGRSPPVLMKYHKQMMYSGGGGPQGSAHYNPDTINQILKDFSDKQRQLESPDLIQMMPIEESFIENSK